jgi:putative hydrolase
MADLLEQQGEQGFRVNAYRRAAPVVRDLDRPVDELLAEKGRDGLVDLPEIGQGIAAAIAEMVTTGHWAALDRLTGALDPETLMMTVPGIGARTARRLCEELHIETLEELEQAAHDGRLEQVEGFGRRRCTAVQSFLRDHLRTLRGRTFSGRMPPVALLLKMDELYRERAERKELKLIAPRRFNPNHLAWLPVMHEHQRGWHFTALFSNTARAHQLRKSRDWVILHASHDKTPDWQCTVVTETRGTLKGRRVVRGREKECEAFYASTVAA